MNQQEFLKQVPNDKSSKKLPSLNLNKNKSFLIYNPQLLSLNHTQFQLDKAKDNLIKHQAELMNQQRQLEIVLFKKAIIQSKVLSNTQVIHSILSKHSALTNNNDSADNNDPHNQEMLIIDESQEQYYSPLLPSRQINLINSLGKTNNTLSCTIREKEFELNSLKQRSKISRFTQLHLTYDSNKAQLNEIKKNYQLLKLQYDELNYRLNRTIEECNFYKELIIRYKTLSLQYKKNESDLKSKTSTQAQSNKNIFSNLSTGSIPIIKFSKFHIDITNNNDDNIKLNKKPLYDLKNSISKLNIKIEEKCKLSSKAESKHSHLVSQLNKIDENITDEIKIIKHIEDELMKHNGHEMKRHYSDLDEEMIRLNNNIDISKHTLVDLNSSIEKTKKEIGFHERLLNKSESELDKDKAENRVLKKVNSENKEKLNDLEKVNEKNSRIICKLMEELEKLQQLY